MRSVIQRVKSSQVHVDNRCVGSISRGLTVLLGVEAADDENDVAYLAEKISGLRIFEDADGKMNRSVQDVNGDLLVISQFTLFGDCRKGKRPSFDQAAKPEQADRLYRAFVDACKRKGLRVEEGIFRADMLVSIENDGPVTILLDSKKQF